MQVFGPYRWLLCNCVTIDNFLSFQPGSGWGMAHIFQLWFSTYFCHQYQPLAPPLLDPSSSFCEAKANPLVEGESQTAPEPGCPEASQ